MSASSKPWRYTAARSARHSHPASFIAKPRKGSANSVSSASAVTPHKICRSSEQHCATCVPALFVFFCGGAYACFFWRFPLLPCAPLWHSDSTRCGPGITKFPRPKPTSTISVPPGSRRCGRATSWGAAPALQDSQDQSPGYRFTRASWSASSPYLSSSLSRTEAVAAYVWLMALDLGILDGFGSAPRGVAVPQRPVLSGSGRGLKAYSSDYRS